MLEWNRQQSQIEAEKRQEELRLRQAEAAKAMQQRQSYQELQKIQQEKQRQQIIARQQMETQKRAEQLRDVQPQTKPKEGFSIASIGPLGFVIIGGIIIGIGIAVAIFKGISE